MNDAQEVALVWRAMTNLNSDNRAWGKNVEVYRNLPTPARIRYWAQVQKQAQAGVPAMQALVAEVIKLRLG